MHGLALYSPCTIQDLTLELSRLESFLAPGMRGTEMALTDKRLCVFCGKTPNTKTREHVVPHWLLETTGDPNRVIPLGQNYAKKQGDNQIRLVQLCRARLRSL
jgi:hypothetical protein